MLHWPLGIILKSRMKRNFTCVMMIGCIIKHIASKELYHNRCFCLFFFFFFLREGVGGGGLQASFVLALLNAVSFGSYNGTKNLSDNITSSHNFYSLEKYLILRKLWQIKQFIHPGTCMSLFSSNSVEYAYCFCFSKHNAALWHIYAYQKHSRGSLKFKEIHVYFVLFSRKFYVQCNDSRSLSGLHFMASDQMNVHVCFWSLLIMLIEGCWFEENSDNMTPFGTVQRWSLIGVFWDGNEGTGN